MAVFVENFSTQSDAANHLECARETLKRCRKARLAMNPEKTYLAIQREIPLGYVVSEKGRESDPKKIVVINELKPLVNAKRMAKVLGHVGWYRDLILNYATVALPITRLLGKDVKFEWTEKCQHALNIFKL